MTLQHPLIFVLLSAALVLLSARSLDRCRAQCYLLLSLLFIGLFYGFALPSLALLAAVLVVHYATLCAMAQLSERGRRILFWAWLIPVVAGFAVVKHYSWLTRLFLSRDIVPAGLYTIGFSFLLFRQIHLAIEVRDGLADSVPWLEYLNYNLAFWTFLAGPVQRFQSFRTQFANMAQRRPDNRTLLLALNRMVMGMLKMFVVGRRLDAYCGCELFLSKPSLLHLARLLLAFPLYIYINFSGYCDIMIGLARAVGFELPENFRKPYLARNSIDFWSRWHITLSEFFRDYFYFPLTLSLGRRTWPWLGTAVATLCSFAVMGAWHGNRAGFVVFGLLHGAGVLAVLLYQAFLKSVLGKEKLQWYRANVPMHAVSVALFQSFVVLSFLPFQFSMEQIRSILRVASHALIGRGV